GYTSRAAGDRPWSTPGDAMRLARRRRAAAGADALLEVRALARNARQRSEPRLHLRLQAAVSRSSRRSTLPIGVFGSVSRNSTRRGTLYPVSWALQCSITASFVSSGSFFTITTFTASPDFTSGTPTTPHSSTPGCDATTPSISFG